MEPGKEHAEGPTAASQHSRCSQLVTFTLPVGDETQPVDFASPVANTHTHTYSTLTQIGPFLLAVTSVALLLHLQPLSM